MNQTFVHTKESMPIVPVPNTFNIELPTIDIGLINMQEIIEDTIGNKIAGGTNVTVVYDDNTGVTTINSTGGGGTSAWGSITGTLSNQTDLQSAIDNKVSVNTAITGATKTKITYDSKGLVTTGVDATTADISDSTNKRYVTDANLTVIGNTSGTNTGDETTSTIKTKLGAASTSLDGYLTTSDWNTFNAKQAALGFTPVTNARTITINGTTFDLTANRTWNVGDLLSTNTYTNPSWLVSIPWSKVTSTPTTLTSYGIASGDTLFDSKYQATLVSGTNIKTINGTSILGSGDITVSGGSSAWGGITGNIADQTDLISSLDGKQATLVSATNIKTINGSSILGSGDLSVGGGAVSWGSVTGTLSTQTDLQAALDAKQGTITLTTTGTSGAATLVSNTLNIPQYSAGLIWSTVTGTTQTAAVNRGYIVNNAAQVVVTLPTTAAVGSIVKVVGKGTGGWRISLPASDLIYFGSTASTAGTTGYIASTHFRDAVELVCVTANSEWHVISSTGNIDIN